MLCVYAEKNHSAGADGMAGWVVVTNTPKLHFAGGGDIGGGVLMKVDIQSASPLGAAATATAAASTLPH